MKIKIYTTTIRSIALGLTALLLSNQIQAQVGAQGLKIDNVIWSDTIATVKIKAVSLTNILALQGSINYNNSSLQYLSATAGANIGTLTGVFSSNQTTGVFTYSISEPSANTVSIATDTNMMTIRFRVINNPKNTYNNNMLEFSNSPTILEIDTTDIAGGGIPVQVLYPANENHTNGYVSFARKPYLTYVGMDIIDTVTNRPVGCTYQWLDAGLPVAGPNSSNYPATPVGLFRCVVTYPNGVTDTSTLSNAILPLRLSKFSGKYIDNSNQLTWSTSVESNTNNFEIERSENNREFVKIGTRKAVGNSGITQNYSFSDANVASKLSLYYRLKITDNNGTFTYSNIIKITKETKTSVTMYPNPAKDFVNITGEKMQQITVTDLMGKIVITKSLEAVNNTILNIASLSKGVYNLNVTTIDATKSMKLIVQ